MSTSSVWSSAPADHGPARDAWILDQVRTGNVTYEFAEVVSQIDGHAGYFYVFRDALKIGGVRVEVTANVQQQIADMLGCSLLTPRLADLLYAQRSIDLSPVLGPSDSTMDDTSVNQAKSQKIDDAIQAAGGDTGGIIQTVGKHWVLVNALAGKLHLAANYGWHFTGTSYQGVKGEPSVSLDGVRVIQGVGTRHNDNHDDYSQLCVLVGLECEIDGETWRLEDVLAHPVLSALVSHEGPLLLTRLPGTDPGADLVPPPTATDVSGPHESGQAGSQGSTLKKVAVAAAVAGAAGLAWWYGHT